MLVVQSCCYLVIQFCHVFVVLSLLSGVVAGLVVCCFCSLYCVMLEQFLSYVGRKVLVVRCCRSPLLCVGGAGLVVCWWYSPCCVLVVLSLFCIGGVFLVVCWWYNLFC